MGQLVFQATAGGQTALVGPNPSTNFSLNVPAVNGNLVTTGDTGTVTSTMLASSVYTTPGTIGSGTPNTGAFTSLSATSFTNTGTDTATKFIPTGSSVVGNGLYLPATNALGLSTNGTNALYIDSSQNVGIGTASPTDILNVTRSSAANSNGGLTLTNTDNSGYGSALSWNLKLNSTAGVWGRIYTEAASTTATFMAFQTAVGSTLAERMRIDSSGRLFIGRTSASAGNGTLAISNASAATGCIDLTMKNGGANYMTNTSGTTAYTAWEFDNNGGSYTTCGSIVVSGTTTVYNITSDARLKTNIVDAPLGNIDDVKVRSFDWKSDNSHVEYGFIAQELIEVAPYAVHQPQDPEKMMAIDYSKLVPMMIKEIQDLKQRIKILENK